jgi:hypothetical protein
MGAAESKDGLEDDEIPVADAGGGAGASSQDALPTHPSAVSLAGESTEREEDRASESPQSQNREIPGGGTSGMNRTTSFAATEESLFANSGISTADFEFLKVVGDGYYGKVCCSTRPARHVLTARSVPVMTNWSRQVFAVRHRDSSQVYAMKAIKKDRVVQVRDFRSLRAASIAARGKGCLAEQESEAGADRAEHHAEVEAPVHHEHLLRISDAKCCTMHQPAPQCECACSRVRVRACVRARARVVDAWASIPTCLRACECKRALACVHMSVRCEGCLGPAGLGSSPLRVSTM